VGGFVVRGLAAVAARPQQEHHWNHTDGENQGADDLGERHEAGFHGARGVNSSEGALQAPARLNPEPASRIGSPGAVVPSSRVG